MILLVRHALVDACGTFLAGRMPGVHLNDDGVRQAASLADYCANLRFAAIYTSPLERAWETAAAIARDHVPVSVAEDLNEIDFGEWTGLSFDELNQRHDWRAFNRSRSAGRIPGGESMLDVRLRACRALTQSYGKHQGEHVALVSHGDVLRTLVAHLLGSPLDRIDQFTIDPASVSVLEPTWRGFELTRLNCHADRDHRCTSHN